MDRKEARRKAQELVMKMTIEEKASQLRYDSPGISRLGHSDFRRVCSIPEQFHQTIHIITEC